MSSSVKLGLLGHAPLALALALVPDLAGCTRRDPEKPASPADGAASTALGTKAVPSNATRDLDFGDTRVRFFAPEGLPNGTRPAFVLVLHGLGGSGSELVAALGLEAFATRKQFMFAAPNGTLDAQGRRFWNANAVCCNFQGVEVDDVARLTALVDHAVGSLHADPKRVFVVGYSNGGFMAHRLACERSGRVRAIVSIAAAGPGPSQHCTPEQPVSVLEIHGANDSIVPFAGGHLFGRAELPRSPSVASGLAVWARKAQCGSELRPFQRFDLLAQLPGSDTEAFRYSDCRAGSPLLWKVDGAGHVIPLDAGAVDAIWEFLAAQG